MLVKGEARLLTDGYDGGPAGAGLSTPSTKGQDGAQPAETDLLSVAVEIGNQGAGGLELAKLAGVRRVADSEDRFEPARASRDGSPMDEGFKAGPSSVGTIATLTDTTEWKGGDVQGGIVDRSTSGASVCKN